tara:strand:+ start:3271 stop:3588 length:318 start_codon:yes stop_codon:yes gene_type:complete
MMKASRGKALKVKDFNVLVSGCISRYPVPSKQGCSIDMTGKERQRYGRVIWLAAMAIVVLAGVVVPYGFLAHSERALAVPLFWLLFGVVVIALIVIGVARWRDDA